MSEPRAIQYYLAKLKKKATQSSELCPCKQFLHILQGPCRAEAIFTTLHQKAVDWLAQQAVSSLPVFCTLSYRA
jgi:hypothetical protein